MLSHLGSNSRLNTGHPVPKDGQCCSRNRPCTAVRTTIRRDNSDQLHTQRQLTSLLWRRNRPHCSLQAYLMQRCNTCQSGTRIASWMTIPRGSRSRQNTGPRLQRVLRRCNSCQPCTRWAQTQPKGNSVLYCTHLGRRTMSRMRKSSPLGTDPRAARARLGRSRNQPCNQSGATHHIQAFRKTSE
jgi:hypothetical protein